MEKCFLSSVRDLRGRLQKKKYLYPCLRLRFDICWGEQFAKGKQNDMTLPQKQYISCTVPSFEHRGNNNNNNGSGSSNKATCSCEDTHRVLNETIQRAKRRKFTVFPIYYCYWRGSSGEQTIPTRMWPEMGEEIMTKSNRRTNMAGRKCAGVCCDSEKLDSSEECRVWQISHVHWMDTSRKYQDHFYRWKEKWVIWHNMSSIKFIVHDKMTMTKFLEGIIFSFEKNVQFR